MTDRVRSDRRPFGFYQHVFLCVRGCEMSCDVSIYVQRGLASPRWDARKLDVRHVSCRFAAVDTRPYGLQDTAAVAPRTKGAASRLQTPWIAPNAPRVSMRTHSDVACAARAHNRPSADATCGASPSGRGAQIPIASSLRFGLHRAAPASQHALDGRGGGRRKRAADDDRDHDFGELAAAHIQVCP